jgi:hypothetical protein
MRVINKFGRTRDGQVDTDIWSGANDYPWPTYGSVLRVRSTNAQDNPSGIGAHTIRIEGLNIKLQPREETLTLDGRNPVFTTQEFFRVQRVYGLECGDDGCENKGNINIRHDGTLVARIDKGMGQTLMSIYTTPDGDRKQLHRWWAAAPPVNDVEIALQYRTDFEMWRTREVMYISNNVYERDFIKMYVPPRSDIRIRIIQLNPAGTSIVAGFAIDR